MNSELMQKVTPLLKAVEEAINLSGEDMLALGESLKPLWDDAVARGDDHAQELIQVTWDKAQALQQRAADSFVNTVGLATVATESILQQEATQREYDNLAGAAKDGNENHPLLKDFAETIRRDAHQEYEEWMDEEGWPEAMAEAFEEIRVAMVEKIRNIADCDYEAANRFAGALMGRRVKLTEYQLQVFKNLMTNIEGQWAEAVAR